MREGDTKPGDTMDAKPSDGDGAWWCAGCQEFALLTNYLCGDCRERLKDDVYPRLRRERDELARMNDTQSETISLLLSFVADKTGATWGDFDQWLAARKETAPTPILFGHDGTTGGNDDPNG